MWLPPAQARSFGATPETKYILQSLIPGAQERPLNGKSLITESDGGRLLEATHTGTIVYEFINPI